jgi:HEPN domain-containing protein
MKKEESAVVSIKILTDFILSRVRAEKILCFGSSVYSIDTTSCFTKHTLQKSMYNTYLLLIIPSATEQIPDFALQQRIEQEMKHLGNITVIVHRMIEINAALKNGSSFFTGIYKKGILWHDAGQECFITPSAGTAVDKRIARREQFWIKWFLLSENFLKGAIFYMTTQHNNLAVFMLHQTLQHCYTGILRTLLGYHANSNSLSRLLNLMDSVLPQYSLSPNDNSPENSRLAKFLNKGFGEARYNDKFEISDQELSLLVSRVKNILQQANTDCLNHIKKLKNNNTLHLE